MQIVFESDGSSTRGLQEPVLREARKAMHRVSWVVSRATIKVSEAFGGPDESMKQVRVEYALRHFATVVATARAADWRLALNRALRRAKRALPAMRRDRPTSRQQNGG